MKTLQCNFTTQEQSKRLLELGVPADSADCYYVTSVGKKPNIIHSEFHFDVKCKTTAKPCWSVGRLIEIAKRCSKSRYALRGLFSFLEECEADECMFQVMDYFEICNYQFDFSKLE